MRFENLVALGIVGLAILFLGWVVIADHTAIDRCQAKGFSMNTCHQILNR